MSDTEEGVGCRPALEALLVFVGLLVVAGILFFTGDPESVPFWRLWVLSSFAPATGVLMSFGATGMAWSVDGVVWTVAAYWVARADSRSAWRKRMSIAITVALILGLVTASAG